MNATPLNIAPHTARYSPLTWIALAAALAVLGISVLSTYTRLMQLQSISVYNGALEMKAKAVAQQRIRDATNGKSQAKTERERSNRAFQALVHPTWDNFFDVLETGSAAVNSGVSIMSLTPKQITPEAFLVDLTVIAANIPVMLRYLDTLNSDPRVRSVELLTQQSETKTGADAIRLQLTLHIDRAKTAPNQGNSSHSGERAK